MVSIDHSLPEVQQQGKGAVKEAAQCDNGTQSSASTQCVQQTNEEASMRRWDSLFVVQREKTGAAYCRCWVTAQVLCSRCVRTVTVEKHDLHEAQTHKLALFASQLSATVQPESGADPPAATVPSPVPV